MQHAKGENVVISRTLVRFVHFLVAPAADFRPDPKLVQNRPGLGSVGLNFHQQQQRQQHETTATAENKSK